MIREQLRVGDIYGYEFISPIAITKDPPAWEALQQTQQDEAFNRVHNLGWRAELIDVQKRYARVINKDDGERTMIIGCIRERAELIASILSLRIIEPFFEESNWYNTAPHLRGRVFCIGEDSWHISLHNTYTGQMINDDGPYISHAHALHAAEQRVAHARAAWMFSFDEKDTTNRSKKKRKKGKR